MTSESGNPEDSELEAGKQTQSQRDTEPQGSAGAEVDQVFDEVLEEVQAPVERTSDQRVLDAEAEALRARAEMENFRKRMQRDSEQQLKYANMSLIRDLLEVWDNLQRAMDAANGEETAQGTKALCDGVSMVSQQMSDVLGKFGCKRVDALGVEFDPNVHEAISQMPSDEYAAGIVMNEVAVGYVLHDRVVRPSHVIVSTGKAEG